MKHIQVYDIENQNEFETAVARISSSWQNYRQVTITVEEEIDVENE